MKHVLVKSLVKYNAIFAGSKNDTTRAGFGGKSRLAHGNLWVHHVTSSGHDGLVFLYSLCKLSKWQESGAEDAKQESVAAG
jgi:hypothetical protein